MPKHSQTHPISYHSPCAGRIVVNSRQCRYQIAIPQTAAKTEIRAQPRATGSIGPRKQMAPRTNAVGASSWNSVSESECTLLARGSHRRGVAPEVARELVHFSSQALEQGKAGALEANLGEPADVAEVVAVGRGA